MSRTDTITDVPKGEDHSVGWEGFDLRDFRDSGLLWKVNHDVLWPLGLALTIRAKQIGENDFDWANATLYVTQTVPPTAIESGQSDAKAKAFEAWIADREVAP